MDCFINFLSSRHVGVILEKFQVFSEVSSKVQQNSTITYEINIYMEQLKKMQLVLPSFGRPTNDKSYYDVEDSYFHYIWRKFIPK